MSFRICLSKKAKARDILFAPLTIHDMKYMSLKLHSTSNQLPAPAAGNPSFLFIASFKETRGKPKKKGKTRKACEG